MSKEEEFERLWNNDALKGRRFRSWLMQKVKTHNYEGTKENCKLYWLGKLKSQVR